MQFAFWKISNQMKQRWTSDIGKKCAWRLIQVWSKESIRICKTTSKNQESSRLKSSQDVVISSHSEYLLNSSKTKKCLQCGPMASSERTKWNLLLWIIKYGNGVKTHRLWKLHYNGEWNCGCRSSEAGTEKAGADRHENVWLRKCLAETTWRNGKGRQCANFNLC